MDVGPRATRPVERRTAARPEQARRPLEEKEEPKPPHRTAAPRYTPKEEKSSKRFLWPIVIAVIVIILAVGGWLAWSKMSAGAPAIDSGKYQAVFFTNGQVYFGKLQPASGGYMKLTEVYYLQSQQSSGGSDTSKNPQATSSDQNNVQLIKLGDEIHGPEDEMIISKDQMLFYENLKDDGKVAQSIKQYKESH